MFNIPDEYNRECLSILVKRSLNASDVSNASTPVHSTSRPRLHRLRHEPVSPWEPILCEL